MFLTNESRQDNIVEQIMTKLFKSKQSGNAWWDDDDLANNAERFDVQNPIGLSLLQLKYWAENLCEQFGENSILSDLNIDDDLASIEIEKE